MTTLNIPRTRDLLQNFDFKSLFIEELGWSQPSLRKPAVSTYNGATFEQRQIADLSGVAVFEITAQGGNIPDAKTRAAIHKEVTKLHHENLLIFLDQKRTQSLWYWVKREDGKSYPREHPYVRGQPGDLFLSKLGAMVVDLSDFGETGIVPVVEVASRLKSALDIEKVTKRFYKEFSEQHLAFLELIQGINDERQRRWYASVLLNRLMFIYFLQHKYFLDNGNRNYLQDKLAESRLKSGKDKFFSVFLKALFFEGFAKPEEQRSQEARRLLGNIRYLNGGLFLPHSVELANPNIRVPDLSFENLFSLFARYSWNLNDTPGGDDDEINPDVLGYIFEKYINQKVFGAYYTRPEITEYLCEQTIFKLILEKINVPEVPGLPPSRRFDSVANSFVLDWILRQKITTTLNMFYIYQLPVPRLTEQDFAFTPIMIRAAKLICTTPEFDDLARDIGLDSHRNGATDPTGRAKLRAELDGLIAHLYGLTEDEFAYILTTFPVVPEPVKVAAQNAYRDVERGLIK